MKDEFERGLEKGIELGEMNEKIRITRIMITCGYEVKEISKITDLSKKIVLEIKADMSNL